MFAREACVACLMALQVLQLFLRTSTLKLAPLFSLNNYKITLEIEVETTKNKEYIYGVKEKYEYLMKINPQIKVLKNEFDLDL